MSEQCGAFHSKLYTRHLPSLMDFNKEKGEKTRKAYRIYMSNITSKKEKVLL
jgi:hypothetical protein